MRNPLDQRFLKTQQLMKSGLMVGRDRPIGRVTWAKASLRTVTSNRAGVGTVRYLDKSVPEHEALTIQKIEIQRSIGQDAATCTITMLNARAATSQPEGVDTAGTKGYLTPGRGTTQPATQASLYDKIGEFHDQSATEVYPTSWNYAQNPYRDVFIPNTVLRTYQGYGSDNLDDTGNLRDITDPQYVHPALDAQLYMTGVWLIDNVSFTANGTMTIQCRDLGKLLIEQFIYPPMIPIDRFPLIYCPAHAATGQHESIGRNVASFHSSSVDYRHSRNYPIKGHRGTHAFDARNDTFWLSGTNTSQNGIEWLQANVKGPINEIELSTVGGNYLVFVAVHENGRWQGTAKVTGTSEDKKVQENLSESEAGGSGGFFYVISKGDTLWDLAGKYYDDHQKWRIIAHANANIIKDPHWIYPGQKIKIPYVAGTKSSPPKNQNVDKTVYTAGTRNSIPYVVQATVPGSGKVTIKLPRTYNARYVRVVFTNLHHLVNDKSTFRVGVREMEVRNHIPNTYVASTIGKEGFIQDWTEPIKEMLAWAGLTWADASPNKADPVLGVSVTNAHLDALRAQLSDLQKARANPKLSAVQQADLDDAILVMQNRIQQEATTPVAKPLRVFGDTEILGAGPVVCTPGDYFMSKSFMDGIRQIVDFIGGIFFIDESGGSQFRLPNIWSGGNFIDDDTAGTALAARVTGHPIEFHEEANIIDYTMVISDESLRSEVLVIGGYPDTNHAAPIAGGYVLGYNSATHTTSAIDFSNVLAGQYRLMVLPGDTTKLFYTEEECQRMAELTGLFILFTYRQGNLKAPCHPGLQIDDQVRIFERTTSESYIHYVSSIDTSMDLVSGEYTMQVTTHWLGKDPDTDWFIDKQQLTPAVKNLPALLKRVGKQAGGDVFEQPPYGVS